MCLLLILLKLQNIRLITSWQEPQQCSLGTYEEIFWSSAYLFSNSSQQQQQKNNTQVQVNMSLVTRWAQSSICTRSEEFASAMRRVFSQPVNGREREARHLFPLSGRGCTFWPATVPPITIPWCRWVVRMIECFSQPFTTESLSDRAKNADCLTMTRGKYSRGSMLSDDSFSKDRERNEKIPDFSDYCILSTALTDPHSKGDLWFTTPPDTISFSSTKERCYIPCVIVFGTFHRVPNQQPSLFGVIQHDTATMHIVAQHILHRVLFIAEFMMSFNSPNLNIPRLTNSKSTSSCKFLKAAKAIALGYLAEVLSKCKACTLPPHCTYNCGIDLLPRPTRGRLYLLMVSAPHCKGKWMDMFRRT